MTVRELIAWYLARKDEADLQKPRLVYTRKSQVKPLLAALGDTPVPDVNAKVLAEYRVMRRGMKSLRGGPMSHATINRELGYLRAAMREAYKEEILERVPYVRMMPERGGKRVDYWKPEQFKAVVAKLEERHPTLADLIRFYYETGWRKLEALHLRWDEVHWDQGVVIVPPERIKTEEARVLPIEGRIREILERRKADARAGCPWVFHRKGKKRRDFKRVWDWARRETGCWNLIHGFRRTFAVNQRRAGVPFDVTMKLAGWRTDSIRRTYAIVDESDLKDAMRKMRNFLGVFEESGDTPGEAPELPPGA